MSQSAEIQEARLREVQADAPDIANEVRSLRANHSSKTIMESTRKSRGESLILPKPNFEPIQSHSLLVSGWLSTDLHTRHFVGSVCILGLYLRNEINRNAKDKYLAGLKNAIKEKKNRFSDGPRIISSALPIGEAEFIATLRCGIGPNLSLIQA